MDIEKYIETGIPCFECGLKSGIDCPGRKKDESTRCQFCFEKYMEQEAKLDEEHRKNIDQC